jgi:hypothetical protein
MKKITLFEEINRMKTLMNVKVLTEAPLSVGPLEKSAEELWNYSKKLFSRGAERNSVESIENTLNKLKTLVDRESELYLDRLSSRIATQGVERVEKEVLEFLANSKTFQEKIFKELERNFQSEVEELLTKTATSPEMMETFDGLFMSAIDRSGGDVEQAKEILRSVLAPELSDERILEKYFENVEVKQDNSGNWIIKQKPNTINPFDPNHRPTETGAGNGPGLNNEEVINNVVNLSKKTGSLRQIIQSLIKSMNLKDLQTVLAGWRNGFKSIDRLAKEFELYSKRMEKNIESGLRYDSEIASMQNILISVKRHWGELPKTTWEAFIDSCPNKVKEVLKGYEKTGADWKIFWNELNQEKEWYEPLLTEGQAFWKLNPFRFPGSKTGGWMIFKKPQPELGKRLRNLILFKDPRTMAEMKQALIANGVRQDLIRTIMSKFIMETLVGPVILSSVGQFVRPAIAGIEGLYNALNDTDANFINYNEPNEKGERSSDVIEIIKKDWGQYLKSLIPESISEFTTPWYLTYVDEFLTSVVSPFITAQKAIEQSNVRDKVREFGLRKTKEFEIWYNTLNESAKKVVDDYTKKIKDFDMSTDEPTDEQKFKDFINNDWKDPKTNISQLYGTETYTKNGDSYTVTQYDPITKTPSLYKYKWDGTTFKNEK